VKAGKILSICRGATKKWNSCHLDGIVTCSNDRAKQFVTILFTEVDSFLVPIDSEILVSPRPDDYESLIDDQFTLQHLPSKMSSFTDVFRVLSWTEVLISLLLYSQTVHKQ